MAIYTIVVKRGNLEYSLSVDDKVFVEAHIDRVFSDLKNRERRPEDMVLERIKLENKPQTYETPQEKTDLAPISVESAEPFEVLYPKPPVIPSIEPTKVVEEQPKVHSASINEEEISKLEQQKLIENIFAPKLEPVAQNVQPPQEENKVVSFNFEDILEEKMTTPVESEEALYEEAVPIAENYEVFVKNKSPESMLDYLVITAYYMAENEGLHHFAIKQLNQKLFSSMKLLVDNKTAQTALERGFIEVVSDYAENGITEYALTTYGRNYYLNDCK